jgi:hypothetical protein
MYDPTASLKLLLLLIASAFKHNAEVSGSWLEVIAFYTIPV